MPPEFDNPLTRFHLLPIYQQRAFIAYVLFTLVCLGFLWWLLNVVQVG